MQPLATATPGANPIVRANSEDASDFFIATTAFDAMQIGKKRLQVAKRLPLRLGFRLRTVVMGAIASLGHKLVELCPVFGNAQSL